MQFRTPFTWLVVLTIIGVTFASCGSIKESSRINQKLYQHRAYVKHKSASPQTQDQQAVAKVEASEPSDLERLAIEPETEVLASNTTAHNRSNATDVAGIASTQQKVVKAENKIQPAQAIKAVKQARTLKKVLKEQLHNPAATENQSTWLKWRKGLGAAGSDIPMIVMVLLALFIPPLAVFLHRGIDLHFWISLILTLLIISWVFAFIHALLVIFDYIN